MTTPPSVQCVEPGCRRTAEPTFQDGRGRWFYRCPDGHVWKSQPRPRAGEDA